MPMGGASGGAASTGGSKAASGEADASTRPAASPVRLSSSSSPEASSSSSPDVSSSSSSGEIVAASYRSAPSPPGSALAQPATASTTPRMLVHQRTCVITGWQYIEPRVEASRNATCS